MARYDRPPGDGCQRATGTSGGTIAQLASNAELARKRAERGRKSLDEPERMTVIAA